MLMNHSFIIGSSIAALAIIAMLPKSAQVLAKQPFINQPLLEISTPRFTDRKALPKQYEITKKGLPKRRDGGGTRFV